MYSNKQNVLQLAALLKAHGVTKIVICPGARSAVLAQTLTQMEGVVCYPVSDERSAGFFALGLSLQGGNAVAVVCSSGSPLLNLHPAVAEAAAQQVPLVVVSADAVPSVVGQMESETLPQTGMFGTLVKCAVNLPEPRDEEEKKYVNRLINEALLATAHHGKGPVHINLVVAEPMYRFTEKELPEVRVITRYQGLNLYDRDYRELVDRLNRYNKRMVVVGQMNLIYLFEKKDVKPLCKHFVWLTEHLSNQTVPGYAVRNFDTAIYVMDEARKQALAPELLITYGGQVVSPQLKKYLKKYPPKEHWHIASDGKIVDPYGTLTTVIEMSPFEFLEKIVFLLDNRPIPYPQMWENYVRGLTLPALPYSEAAVVGRFLQRLPEGCALHFANGSVLRHAQLFELKPGVEVVCNRGVGGKEGTLSTAMGYAAASQKLNFVVLGDVAFFCGVNLLLGMTCPKNVRILLLNNGGAASYCSLPGMRWGSVAHRSVVAEHAAQASGIAGQLGMDYLKVEREEELAEAMNAFVCAESPVLLEVFTQMEHDVRVLTDFYHTI